MLFLTRTMTLFILCLSIATVNAQTKKNASAAFTNFSESIEFSESTLTNAIQISKGQQATMNFGNELNFSGEVISNEIVFDNLQTIIIRSSNYNNALLQISKQRNEDNSITYVGRIFSQGSSDGYQIKKADNGNYQLQKFETTAILQDCELH